MTNTLPLFTEGYLSYSVIADEEKCQSRAVFTASYKRALRQ